MSLSLARHHRSRTIDPATGLPEGLDDLAALRRYATTGDPAAFELLAHRYHAMVLATCRRVLRSEADAEDAAQQAFLQLAAHAGRVKSNAAAWLHAAAMHTALDLHRAQDARRRAEAGAATAPVEHTEPDTLTPEWRELEPRLDAALAALNDADRELIVARFLAGRSQADLAAEAGVHPGTLGRRLEKALDRLRAHLRVAGVAFPATALAVALSQAPAPASPALAATLAKVGLAGSSRAARTSAPLAIKTAATIAITLGVVGGGAWILSASGGLGAGGNTAVAFAPPSAPKPVAPDRPGRPTKPMTLVATSVPLYGHGGMTCDGRTMGFMLSDSGGERSTLIARIDDSERRPGELLLKATVTDADLADDAGMHIPVGTKLDITARTDRLGRLALITTLPTPPGADGPVETTWLGVRPGPGSRERARIPAKPGPLGIEGPWYEAPDWTFTVGPDEITMETGGWVIHRFRYIEWAKAGDHARIQLFAADSFDPRLVGKRLKMLLQRRGDTYTLAYHDHASPRLNEWPRSFDPKPEEGVQVLSWTEAKP